MAASPGYNPLTGEYNDSLTGHYLWSSVNTREATPDVLTPYTWSVMRYGFSQMTMLPIGWRERAQVLRNAVRILLRTGDLVRVDGAKGEVEILERRRTS